MGRRFEGTAVIDRPIDEVFAYLAEGTHDPEFSPRVQEIRKTPEGPTAVGTVFASTVKDAGMKTEREFEIVELESPTRIRWTERTRNIITVPTGGYDLAPEGAGTRVTIFNEFEGHGFGKLILGFAHKAAVKDAPSLADRIKQAVEAG